MNPVSLTPKTFFEALALWSMDNEYTLQDVRQRKSVAISPEKVQRVYKIGGSKWIHYYSDDGSSKYAPTRNLPDSLSSTEHFGFLSYLRDNSHALYIISLLPLVPFAIAGMTLTITYLFRYPFLSYVNQPLFLGQKYVIGIFVARFTSNIGMTYYNDISYALLTIVIILALWFAPTWTWKRIRKRKTVSSEVLRAIPLQIFLLRMVAFMIVLQCSISVYERFNALPFYTSTTQFLLERSMM